MGKKTKLADKRIVKGKPLEVHVPSYKDQLFTWSIRHRYLDFSEFGKRFFLFNDKDEFMLILKALDNFSEWKWRNIEMSHKNTSSGFMAIVKLDTCDEIVRHLTFIGENDIDVLYKIEVKNDHRIWGIRENACLFLIWNDTDHMFYKHKNKNYTKKCTDK